MKKLVLLLFIILAFVSYAQTSTENEKIATTILELVKQRKIGQDASEKELNLILKLTDNISNELDKDATINEKSIKLFISEISAMIKSQTKLTVEQQMIKASIVAANFNQIMKSKRFDLSPEELGKDELFDELSTVMTDLISVTNDSVITYLYGDQSAPKRTFKFPLLPNIIK